MATTPRWRLPTPAASDNADVPTDMAELAVACDDFSKIFSGTLAARPAAGNRGTYYLATDDRTTPAPDGTLWLDNGSAWVRVNGLPRSSVTSDYLGADSVLSAAIATGAVGPTEIADGTVGVRHAGRGVDGLAAGAFSAYLATSLSVSASARSTVVFARETADPSSSFNSSTGVFTAPYTGLYDFSVQILAYSSGGSYYVYLKKSSTILKSTLVTLPSSAAVTGPLNTVESLTAGDTLSVEVYNTSGSTLTVCGNDQVLLGNTVVSWFSGHLIGKT